MTANKEAGRVDPQLFFHCWVIGGRIAADMGHVYIYFFGGPTQLFRVEAPDVLSVDIAIDATQGLEGGQSPGQIGSTKISRVPDLIAGIEMTEDIVVQEMVGVRYKADAQH